MYNLIAAGLGAMSSLEERAQNRDNIKVQREENERAREFSKYQTRMNALYNSPAVLANKLRAAGVNPQGSLSPGSVSSSSPSIASMPVGENPMKSFGSVFSEVASGLNSTSVIEGNKANTDKIKAETANIKQDTLSKIITDCINMNRNKRENTALDWQLKKEAKELDLAINKNALDRAMHQLAVDQFNENTRQFNESFKQTVQHTKFMENLALRQYDLDHNRYKLDKAIKEQDSIYKNVELDLKDRIFREQQFTNWLNYGADKSKLRIGPVYEVDQTDFENDNKRYFESRDRFFNRNYKK